MVLPQMREMGRRLRERGKSRDIQRTKGVASMKPLKYVRCEIRKPRYDPHPDKSTTQNSEWRQGLFLIFEDYDGKEYDYMPTWKQLSEILDGRATVEKINQRLAFKNRKRVSMKGGFKQSPMSPCTSPDTKPTIRDERWEK